MSAAASAADLGSSGAPAASRSWFQDARFGMFIHFGLYTTLERGEWVMHNERILPADYQKRMAVFNPSEFDARAWVDLAKAAGQRYMTITSKHHEGFCMFRTVTSNFGIVHSPFGRDLIGELAELAVRDRFGQQQPRERPGPHRQQPVLQRGPDIASRGPGVAVASQQGIGDAGQRHPARHPRQHAGRRSGRERLRASAGREGQHRLPGVGVAFHGWSGGEHPYRAARMLADPAERDRSAMMKRRDQRLHPLRDTHPGVVGGGGGVGADVRPTRELGDLPRRQVSQELPRSAVRHDVPRLHPLADTMWCP